MKKLFEKDKKLRQNFKYNETSFLILSSIFKNLNYSFLVRLNAFLKLKNAIKSCSKTSVVNRCVLTMNKKRYNKMTSLSRNVFLKLLRSGQIHGFKRSNW